MTFAAAGSEPRVLVASALPQEIGGLARALVGRRPLQVTGPGGGARQRGAAAWEGRLGGHRVALTTLGMGREATERALAPALDALQPIACLLIGFAGGCQPDLLPGEAVLASPLLCEPDKAVGGVPIEGRDPIALEPGLLAGCVARCGPSGVRRGPLVTVNVLATPSAKDSLWRNRGALACDMETFWAARQCRERGVPFAALRVVFDAVSERLPPLPPTGTLRAVLRRPLLARHLPWLALRFVRARRALDRLTPLAVGALAGAGAPAATA